MEGLLDTRYSASAKWKPAYFLYHDWCTSLSWYPDEDSRSPLGLWPLHDCVLRQLTDPESDAHPNLLCLTHDERGDLYLSSDNKAILDEWAALFQAALDETPHGAQPIVCDTPVNAYGKSHDSLDPMSISSATSSSSSSSSASSSSSSAASGNRASSFLGNLFGGGDGDEQEISTDEPGYVLAGHIYHMGATMKKWNKRYVRLSHTTLALYKNKSNRQPTLEADLASIRCVRYVEGTAQRTSIFEVERQADSSIFLSAASELLTARWATSIRKEAFSGLVLLAAQNADSDALWKAVRNGGFLSTTTLDEQRTPLHLACRAHSTQLIRELAQRKSSHPGDKGIDVNARDVSGNTPILFCATDVQAYRDELVQLLILKRIPGWNTQAIDLHLTDWRLERNVLHHVVAAGSRELVQFLIDCFPDEAQACANQKDKASMTALTIALKNAREDIVRILVEGVAVDFDVLDDHNRTPLHYAAHSGMLKSTMAFVENVFSDSSIDTSDAEGQTALHHAIAGGHLDVVDYLLSAGADALRCDAKGQSVLHLAAWSGKADMLHMLLDIDGVPDLAPHGDAEGTTPLMVAVSKASHDIALASTLLELGTIDVNAQDAIGWTVLHHAAWAGHVAAVELMNDYKADVNITEPSKNATPLLFAVSKGHLGIVEYMVVGMKADVNVKLNTDISATDIALANGHDGIARFLKDHGGHWNNEFDEQESSPA